VLSSLETSLDEALSRAEYVRMLMIALHDEVVENRILAMQIVGRLAGRNTGDVLPPLRKTLIRLLTELKCSFSPCVCLLPIVNRTAPISHIRQSKESAIRILSALLIATRAVVERHVNEVLRVLLDCSKDSNPVVTTHILICIGQLTTVDDTTAVFRQIPQIMAIILSSLSGSSQIRSAALDCLGRLCTNVGYVIIPMEQYPQLLPRLHGMLKREQSPNMRLQVIKAIGLLGALDPVQYQVLSVLLCIPHMLTL
jgi:serine/threonine-protein kinase mTOR